MIDCRDDLAPVHGSPNQQNGDDWRVIQIFERAADSPFTEVVFEPRSWHTAHTRWMPFNRTLSESAA